MLYFIDTSTEPPDWQILEGVLILIFVFSAIVQICNKVETSICQREFLTEFRMVGLPMLHDKLEKFLKLLVTFFFHIMFFFPQRLLNLLLNVWEDSFLRIDLLAMWALSAFFHPFYLLFPIAISPSLLASFIFLSSPFFLLVMFRCLKNLLSKNEKKVVHN